MTRREWLAAFSLFRRASDGSPLLIPVHLIVDRKARWRASTIKTFWSEVWPQAVKDFARGGMRIESTVEVGEVERPPERDPYIERLRRHAINFVLTDQVPVHWDKGRALTGLSTFYRGHVVCMAALHRAHGHRFPFVSVNTCVHELLHALLGDVFESRPGTAVRQARELLVDMYATRLWLFGDGAAIRESARAFLGRLEGGST
jgi:hypothetical protein